MDYANNPKSFQNKYKSKKSNSFSFYQKIFFRKHIRNTGLRLSANASVKSAQIQGIDFPQMRVADSLDIVYNIINNYKSQKGRP